MNEHAAAWLKQAAHDLDVAVRLGSGGDHDWACHAAAQAGEKALKGALLAAGQTADLSHDHVRMLERLFPHVSPGQDQDRLTAAARRLNPLQALARYPMLGSEVAPVDLLGPDDASAAITAARILYDWARSHGAH